MMQQILNSQDRSQAFFKFLLFFLITIVLVVSAIYFDFKMPAKENKWFQNQLEVQQIQDANQSKFVSRMEEAIVLLDSLDKNDSNTDLVNSRVNKIIGDLEIMGPNNKTLYGRMNKAIVSKFDELRRTKIKTLDSKGSADRILKLEQELKDCRYQLSDAQRSLDGIRNTNQ